MECKKIQGLLNDYFDGVLDSGAQDSIEEHLSGCAECRKAYEDMEAVITLMRLSSNPVQMPSEEFFKTVFSRYCPSANSKSSSPKRSSLKKFRPWNGIWDLLRSPSLSLRLARAAALLMMGFLLAYFSPRFLDTIGPVSQNQSSFQDFGNKTRASAIARGKPDVQIVYATPTPIIPDSENNPALSGTSMIDKSHKATLEAALVEAEKSLASPNLTLADKTGPPDMVEDGLLYTVPLPPGALEENNPRILMVATHDRQLAVMESIQKLKMNLHLSGESRFIPEIHKIESYIADIAAATEKTDLAYLTNLKVFQEAEQCLVEKKYTCALQNYDEVAKQSPGSLMSFLALFQTANVNYEQLGDYRSALAQYQKCLEQYPAQYITDEKKEIILNRIDILTRNSMNEWKPLHLYIQSKTAPSHIAIPALKQILDRYPTCSLIQESIEDISTRILSDEEAETAKAEDIISFFQQCRERYETRAIRQLLQYKTAEIFQYRMMNGPQALLEYIHVVEIDPQSKLAEKAKSKILSLSRRGLNIR
ncbi:zf-HC2 domain-containing protein [Candidatus Sumerlaeota bacterium]|nr:zf-HC2 domain-containing protein [Candidatus Sumerlaeota bacterium]